MAAAGSSARWGYLVCGKGPIPSRTERGDSLSCIPQLPLLSISICLYILQRSVRLFFPKHCEIACFMAGSFDVKVRVDGSV